MKTILTILLAVFLTSTGIAQPEPRGEMRRHIQSLRVATYSQVLDLTPAEAEKFWPVFNQFQGQMETYRKQLKEVRRSLQANYSTGTDAQLEAGLNKLYDVEQSILDLKKHYTGEFKRVIPIRKIALIPRAEREFHRELLKKFKAGDDDSLD